MGKGGSRGDTGQAAVAAEQLALARELNPATIRLYNALAGAQEGIAGPNARLTQLQADEAERFLGQISPLRGQVLGELQNVLAGQPSALTRVVSPGPFVIPGREAGSPQREAIENQFSQARRAIEEGTPGGSGLQASLLAGLEGQRAGSVSGLEADFARLDAERQNIDAQREADRQNLEANLRRGLFDVSTGLSTGATSNLAATRPNIPMPDMGLPLGALSGASGSFGQIGQRGATRQAGLGQGIGSLLGSLGGAALGPGGALGGAALGKGRSK